MKLIEQLQRLDRLDSLIRRKATGTPEQLAAKFGCSERTIYNLMNTLKHFEAEMAYCKERCSYFYEQPPAVRFGQLLNPKRSVPEAQEE